jgi:hypothetical protein
MVKTKRLKFKKKKIRITTIARKQLNEDPNVKKTKEKNQKELTLIVSVKILRKLAKHVI